MTVNMTTSIITITPTGACTFNASGGVVGQIVTFAITTSGVSSFTLTWGTNYRKTGTLATGTTSARFFAVTFVCLDGTTWMEISRTAVQT
jgi:Zn-dependent M28 family amino/carboxypeptidase